MFKLLRMNNYYFIVGGSAAWAEIVRILQEKKIPFAWMKSDTEGAVSVPYEKIDEVIAAGFVPVVIGAECGRSDVKVLKKYRHHVNASPLEIVSVWEHAPLATRWQELVLAHDEDCFNEFDYSTEIMRELCRRGFSRDEIDKVRALDREIRGITGAEEAAADECLQKHFTQSKGLLVVANLPHSRYRRFRPGVLAATDAECSCFDYGRGVSLCRICRHCNGFAAKFPDSVFALLLG